MSPGRVYLVGAGPGSPDLITQRGLRALRQATWIIADSLLPTNYLSELGIPVDTRTTWLEHGDTRDRYAEILKEMARAAEAGHIVVRLKNGDPFVFGRGCEEAEFLTGRGIAWEAIPGISVSTAGPTLAGLPLTSRTRGRSFAVVTARCSGGALNRNFPRADTLVIFMGASVLRQIADQLIRDGWSGQTPAAVLSRVSLAWENRCDATLETIAAAAEDGRIASPAILVVGEAAVQKSELPRRPRILFAGEYPDAYRCLGELVHWPALVTVPADEAGAGMGRHFVDLRRGHYGWIAFTSPTSVRLFFQRAGQRRLDARLIGRTQIIAVRDHSRRLLLEHGLRADLVLDGDAESRLPEVLNRDGNRSILVCGGRREVSQFQRWVLEAGGIARALVLFDRRPHPDLGHPMPTHDAILFTSTLEAAAYVEAYGPRVWESQVWYADEAAHSKWTTRGDCARSTAALSGV